MMTLEHSPNCCCEYCMSKSEGDTQSNQEKLESGIPMKERMNQHDDKSYLTPDYEKQDY